MPANLPEGHVLLTGFEPFDGESVNPSQEVAKLLDGTAVARLGVRSLILPVQHEAARARVAPALLEPGLAGVLHVGLAGGRARVSIERLAVNVMDYTIADMAGLMLRDTPCVAGGPVAYLSTLPCRDILQALTAEGIPAHISNTAGTYLCNYALYTTLDALSGRAPGIAAGFLHLPFLPSMVAAHDLEQPSMDLALAAKAVEIALRCAIAPRIGAPDGEPAP